MTLLDDLRRVQKLDPKRKLGIGLILLVTFFLGLVGAFFYWQIRFPLKTEKFQVFQPSKKEPQKESKLASLSLNPSSKNVKVREDFIVNLEIHTGDNQVEAADVVLSFDPKILRVKKVEEGEFFTTHPQNKITDGKIFISGAFGPEGGQESKIPVKGVGRFAKITFTALAASSSTKVSFDAKKTVVASEGKDVLGEKVEGEYTIN